MSHYAEMNWLTIWQFVTLYWINLISVVDEIGTETETEIETEKNILKLKSHYCYSVTMCW